MGIFRRPGLLLRISNLIFIQVIFIFAALAMIFFAPEYFRDPSERQTPDSHWMSTTVDYISRVIERGDNSTALLGNESMIVVLRDYVSENRLLQCLELISLDSVDSEEAFVLLSDVPVDPETRSMERRAGKMMAGFLDGRNMKYLQTVSPDQQYIRYYVRYSSGIRNYLFVLKSPNVMANRGEDNRAEMIVLLFLVSVLISLLIIYLISKEIRRPLYRLIDALGDIASGKEVFVPENRGDHMIRRLAEAFNEMSHNLADEKRKLAESNGQLMKTNKALVESESILTSLVDYSPDAIIVTDLDDQVIIYNHAAARDFGYSTSNMLGKRIDTLMSVPPAEAAAANSDDESIESKEIICRHRDGTRFPALLVSTPLGPEQNRPIAMLYFIKNISESRNYQDMILRLDRVASRGKMARDIAHEINNYLAVLQGNLELLPIIIAKNESEKIDDRIRLLRDTVNSISTFTNGLTKFSDENSEFVKEDLNQLIENLIAFLKPQNKYDDIFLGTNLAENIPMVAVDASQVQLLIVNLLDNAAEALRGKEGKKWIVISTSLDEPGDWFYIKVADNGPGIPSEYHEQVFVNRFSTKKDGNGLGLITCRSIVENHGGEMSYHSTEESKAIFVVRFPVEQKQDNAAAVKTEYTKSQPVAGQN